MIERQMLLAQIDRFPLAIAEIMDNLDDLIWSFTLPDFIPIYFNRAATQAYKSPHQDLLANHWLWLEQIVNADQSKVRAALQQLPEKESCSVDYRIETATDVLCYSAKFKVFRDAENRPIRIDAIAKLMELNLFEERNLAILKALPDLLLLLKPDGTCLQCIVPSTGRHSPFIPVKYHISEVLSPETLEQQLALYAKAIATGKPQIYEHKIIKFGKPFYEEVRISPYCEDELLVVVRDITARKLAEERLLKSDAHLKSAQRIGKLGSWEYNVQADKATWSEEIFRIFGRDPALTEPTYQELKRYVHPEDLERFDQTIQNTLQTHQPYEIDYRLCREDGTLVYVSEKGEVICNEADEPVQIIGTVFDITERKITEQQLQSLTDRLTLAVRSASVGIWEWDIVHNSLFWDERTYELYGIAPDPNLDAYSAWANRLHPSDRADTENAVQQALSGEKEYDTEFRIILPDGNIRYIKAYAIVQRDKQGQPLRLVGINFDITNQKLAEDQLLKSATHLKTAQRIAKIGSWEYELSSGNVTWSEEVYRIYGLDVKSPTPSYEQLQQYVHPEDWQHFDQTVKNAIQTGQSYDLEHRIVHSDGAIIYVFARGEFIFDADGNFTHIVGTAMDVTDRKLAELELVRSRDLREALFNEATDALFLVDTQTLLTTDCNLPAMSLFEANDKSDLIGIEGHKLQRYQFSPQEIEDIVVEANNKGFWSREIEYISRKGKHFWGNLAIKPIAIANQSVNLVRVTDISDRKHAEAQILKTSQELESINRELESFCYSVSHDLRAPLRHINGFVNALRQQIGKQNYMDDPKISHYLQVIDNSSQKMGHLIDGLLTLSRYGRRPLEVKNLAVRDLIDEAIEIISADSSFNPNVRFEIGELPDIVGDPTLLEQVFRNLISNAIKFSRNHPQPCVSISSLSDRTIMIKDNGVGFQMEYADKLFGAFQRLHNEKDFEGTGIGLAIVQRIVQRHHGKVWAESHPNQGATFFVHIP